VRSYDLDDPISEAAAQRRGGTRSPWPRSQRDPAFGVLIARCNSRRPRGIFVQKVPGGNVRLTQYGDPRKVYFEGNIQAAIQFVDREF
jgi:hypothetical protein